MSTYSANINRYNKHACTTIMIVLSIVILYIITYCERKDSIYSFPCVRYL